MEEITIHSWLANRQRKYADGVALFEANASTDFIKRYLSYFKEVGDVPQFDSHFTVLINKLTTVARLSGGKPLLMQPDSVVNIFNKTEDVTKIVDKVANEVKSESVLKDILKKEAEMLELRDRIDELENDTDDKDDQIEKLEYDLHCVNEELRDLQQTFSTLRPGARIVTYSSLPDDVQKLFDRVRKITPLYASLFTEMQNEALTEDERKTIAEQVNELFLERQQLWNTIDDWAEGKELTLQVDVKKNDDIPADQQLHDLQRANRIERLRENIRRTQTAIKMHDENGKLNFKQKAEKRLDEYKQELNALEAKK